MEEEKGTPLSREEMDALLGEEEVISKDEAGGIGQVYKRVFDASSMTLSTLLRKDIKITPPLVKIESQEEFKIEIQEEVFVAETSYDGPFRGPTCLIFPRKVGAIIADLIMGGDGTSPPEEINELYLGAVGEAVSQLVTASTAALSEVIGQEVKISTPKVNLVDLRSEEATIPLLGEERFVKIISELSIIGLIERVLFAQLLSPFLLKAIIRARSSLREEDPVRARVHPVQFAALKPGGTREVPSNLDLLMDVPMEVTVELGRTSMLLKDILKLGVGSVIELEKMAGEPVDFLVNGKLIAKGGVVVIDENFGIKITDIISPSERINNLQKGA